MDEKLIEKVREHEVLYNQGSHDYRDQQIRQTAWEEIGKELQMSGNQAKQRWENLRRCFCNARNRRRDETKSGTTFKKKSSWKYEQQMSFIIPYIESRKSHGNLNESQASVNLTIKPDDLSEESEAEESISSHLKQKHGHSDKEIDPDMHDKQGAHNEVLFNDAGVSEKHYEAVKLCKKQKQNDSSALELVEILKESSALRKRQYEEKKTRSQPSNPTSFLETLDDTDLFFLSMSRMTKQLPKIEQARIKLALSNSVLSAEIRCNQQSFPSTSYWNK